MINTATTNLSDKDLSQHVNKAAYRGVNLAQHRCINTNFTGLDLTGANFEEADCTGANFTDAILDKVNFTRAIVQLSQIQAAKSSEGAMLPTDDKASYDALQVQFKELQAKIAEQEQMLEAQRQAERLAPASEVKKRGQ